MEKKTETQWAIRNLELAGLFDKDSDYGGMLGEAVKRLLETHGKERHSGFSHDLAIDLFARVARGEALTREYWQERFDEYNQLAAEMGVELWSEEDFQRVVCRKPPRKKEKA
jgi:hypothetical protein